MAVLDGNGGWHTVHRPQPATICEEDKFSSSNENDFVPLLPKNNEAPKVPGSFPSEVSASRSLTNEERDQDICSWGPRKTEQTTLSRIAEAIRAEDAKLAKENRKQAEEKKWKQAEEQKKRSEESNEAIRQAKEKKLAEYKEIVEQRKQAAKNKQAEEAVKAAQRKKKVEEDWKKVEEDWEVVEKNEVEAEAATSEGKAMAANSAKRRSGRFWRS